MRRILSDFVNLFVGSKEEFELGNAGMVVTILVIILVLVLYTWVS